jgi:hypothetical protein
MDRPFYYYTQKQGQAQHRLGVNWARLWIMSQLKSWESMQSFAYEVDYGILRCDGFAAIRNRVAGKMSFYFVEYDHTISNPFDKVVRYNQLFERQPSAWWTDLTDRFPAIVVVTHRVQAISKKIEQENVNGLEFRVIDYDKMRSEIWQ